MRFSSFVLVSRLKAELDRLFDEAAELAVDAPLSGSSEPPVDVVEAAHAIRLRVEVPGVEPADLAVEIIGTELVISGIRRGSRAPEGASFNCLERERGRFARRVRLTWPINSQRARAELANGMLTIELPKIMEQRQQRRHVPIEVAEQHMPSTPGSQTS